ncbi:MAG: TlpA family protein disulfide reductase [Bacteroidaceae bacterium]|nr:TlpA family protein disulfide reductase [Bacteroidaceae bacterium]
MKKLFLTLVVAFATVCGIAQEKVWEDVVTGYRTSTVFDVKKVWFYPDRTDVLLHIDFPAGRQARIASGTTLNDGVSSYALKGKSSGAYDGAMYVEYDAPFVVPESGEIDILLSFEPLPTGTERITLNGYDGWVVQNIRSAATLPSGITDTYWRNNATGDWLIGFAEKQVIYDSRFWDIKSMAEKRGGYTLTVENGSDVLDIKVGNLKNGARTIKVGDSRAVKCSPITTAALPDYPVKDNRVGFKDNGYALGDSVTIVGWLKDMPAEAWQRGGNEFEVMVHNVVTREPGGLSLYAKMDSLGRFTLKMPLQNTSQVFVGWKRTMVSTVLEPGETYFFLHDFGTGQKLFMGNDVRLQNELTAYPATFMNERIEHDHATQEQAMEFLHHVKECGRRYNAELQERVGEHPMLSRRYIDYLTGYYRAGMGESLMQGMYSVEGDKLPAEYIAFADSLWNSMIAPLSTDGFSTLSSPKSLYRDYIRFLTDYMYYKVQNMPEQEGSVAKTLQRLAVEGAISLNEKEADAVKRYDSELEKMKAQLATLDGEAEREKLISEFNNSEIVYIINDVWNSNADAIIREFAVKIPQHAISCLPNNKEIYDIYMAGIIWNEINNRRVPLPADVIEWAEKNISTPVAINTVLEMQNRYLALQRRALSGSESLKTNDEVKEMSDGEKILRKLIEPYKGKFVLVDVWGTWCSPCKRALSHSKELYERMAPYDVVFLYLANRSDDGAWKNVIKEYNVTGENVVHYNLPALQQSAVERFLGVNSYPTYRLIDRNGNLLDVNADPRDLNVFENLIKMIK